MLQNAGFAPSTLTIAFSAPVLGFSAAFATDDSEAATPLLLTAYRGAAVVGARLLGAVVGAAAAGLSEQPMLVLEPGMHVAAISDLDLDAAGGTAAAGSLDGPCAAGGSTVR